MGTSVSVRIGAAIFVGRLGQAPSFPITVPTVPAGAGRPTKTWKINPQRSREHSRPDQAAEPCAFGAGLFQERMLGPERPAKIQFCIA